MKLNKDKTRVLIVSHFLINPLVNAASSTSIRNYLLDKVRKVTQIELPFPNSKEKYSYILIFENGLRKVFFRLLAIKNPEWLSYLIQSFAVVYLLLKYISKYNLCIACDNLSFMSVLIFRKLGLIRKLIYYSVDYVEERFPNKVLNRVYHLMDKIACKSSDVNWVVAKEQIIGRKDNGLSIDSHAAFKVVPIAFRNKEINIKTIDQIQYYNLAFIGGLRESTGIQFAISALPELIKKYPRIKIIIIGGGNYRKNLEELTKELGVSKNVEFLGMIASHKKVVKILTKCSIGLAPYAPVENSISFRSDPGKIRLYLACGLPVVTTKIATSGKILVDNKAGLISHYNETGLSKAISYLLSNKNRYLKYRNEAIRLSNKYDLDSILNLAFKQLPT